LWTLWEGVVKQDVTLNHPRLAVFCHYFLGIIDTGLNMVADGVGVDTKHGGRLADSHPIWGPTTTASLLTPFSHIRAFHIPTYPLTGAPCLLGTILAHLRARKRGRRGGQLTFSGLKQGRKKKGR
jgi:hypothetical protein